MKSCINFLIIIFRQYKQAQKVNNAGNISMCQILNIANTFLNNGKRKVLVELKLCINSQLLNKHEILTKSPLKSVHQN